MDVTINKGVVAIANILVEKAVLPEIIGSWFTKPTEEFVVEHIQNSSMGPAQVNDEGTYCYCSGKDDGTKMICCDNNNCCSGQWFHYRCVDIKRAPHGKWFCKECCASEV